MSDQTKTASGASSEKQEETYHVDRLTAEAGDRLGVPPHVAAGAFSQATKKNLTIDEAKQLVKDFDKHEVEVDNPIPTRGEES